MDKQGNWIFLADAVRELVRSGASEDDAKARIASRIADRSLRVRPAAPFGAFAFFGPFADKVEHLSFEVPSFVHRYSFDWDESVSDPHWPVRYKHYTNRRQDGPYTRYRIEISVEDLNALPRSTEKQERVKSRGRPPVYEWDDIEAFVIQELDNRGPPNPQNVTNWQSVADVARAVEEYIATRPFAHPKGCPQPAALQGGVGAMVKRWRTSRGV